MKGVFVLLTFLVAITLLGQTPREEALKKKEQAVQLMDNGKPDEAIALLEEAKKLDPRKSEYDYEIAFAYYVKHDLKNAIKIFKEVVKYDDATDQSYQMLGNMYDIDGNPDMAFKTYDKGLKLFPKSGRLFLEKGNMHYNQKKFDKALSFYELGIKEDPMYASNYYRASLLYFNSTEQIWGMIYGELFMNIERNTKRNAEISKLLYDTYKSQIEFKGDTTEAHFTKDNIITLEDIKNQKMPYGYFVWGSVFMVSLGTERSIDLGSLNRIRSRFVDNYYSMDVSKDKPNALFDFQRKVAEAGYFEAYNYWILRSGNDEAFRKWKAENQGKWDTFIKWFTGNGLLLGESYRFYREQY